MYWEEYPFGVVLTRLHAAIIDAKVRAELERCLDDVPPITHIPEDDIARPEAALRPFHALEQRLESNRSSLLTHSRDFSFLEEVERLDERELDLARAVLLAETRGVVELTRRIRVLKEGVVVTEEGARPRRPTHGLFGRLFLGLHHRCDEFCVSLKT